MKYMITDETINLGGVTLHRIKCLQDGKHAKAGELGGWIESEHNLSQDGEAWIGQDAKVFGQAAVLQDAQVFGEAWVYDSATVMGSAWVSGHAEVFGKAFICGLARIGGDRTVICDDAGIGGCAQVSNATIFGDAYVGGDTYAGNHVKLATMSFMNSDQVAEYVDTIREMQKRWDNQSSNNQ